MTDCPALLGVCHGDASASPAPATAPQGRLLVVSPCRDEARFLRASAASVLAQSCRPDLWILVDDGSTDETPAILAQLAADHRFIRVVTLANRGGRRVGPGVVHAFMAGLEAAGIDLRFEYLSKLDVDLILPPRYFEAVLQRMDDDPRLGTCSGKSLVRRERRLAPEGQGDDMSLGMAKVYRRQCFNDIGGLVPAVMWDGIDCHRARMKGWRAGSFSHPDVDFEHLRPMGASHHGLLTGRFRHGRGQHFMGTGFFYMLASALNWMRRRPLLLGGGAMLAGWIWSAWRGTPRYDDVEFRRFLRHYQRNALLLGKRRAQAQAERGAGVPPGRQSR
ncbi:MAG: glycosyltransferase family 2 protein [Pseudomonadota bacterium]|nr:glycosyltransferase family 2 protein [Pseudomonadota bacterium]